MKSLVSMENWFDCETSSLGRKNERWCMSSQGYFSVVKDSSVSSLLQKQRWDRSGGLLVIREIRGSVELEIM